MVDNAIYGDQADSDDLSLEMETGGELQGADLKPSAGGKSVNREGRYHCIVVAVKKEKESVLDKPRQNPKDGQCPTMSPPSVKITFQVLDGDFDDQKDLMIYHDMYLWKWDAESQQFRLRTGKELKMPLQICRGMGLCTQADVDAGVFAINFKNALHKTCVVEVRNDPYTKTNADGTKETKPNYRIPFGNVWLPDDEEVEDVRKDPEAMLIYMSGKSASGTSAGGQPQKLF